MPDQLCLSLWLRDFDADTMLRHFQELLITFPFSHLRPGVSGLKGYAIEFAEPALFEQLFTGEVNAETLMELAEEFQQPDCAYLVEGWWDIWQYNGSWQLAASPVVLTCYGPQFENDVGDHLRLELGPEELFLPLTNVAQSGRKAQSNLQSILRLAHDIEQHLPLERRTLWSESGEDFAERLEELADEAG